ncbi:MAG: N-acetylmuramic acid 6-phosphate etherase [Lachnospirales bacterium]
MINLNSIETENRNQNTLNIDCVSTYDMVKLMNNEDKLVALAVEKELEHISKAIDCIYEKMKDGGRLVYCGAGTSGRIGVLDAVECPPTFGVGYNDVVAIIAGGNDAFTKAKEGEEDKEEGGKMDLLNINFSKNDVLVGIAASGRTPYVIGAMKYAQTLGSPIISLSCSKNSEISNYADIVIEPLVGAEVITGSTRLKSGTAQKMVLNMLSTGVMIKLGKVYGNLMVDVKATNDKLVERTVHIVTTATGVSSEEAKVYLEKTENSAKHAILMILCNIDYNTSLDVISKASGKISLAIEYCKNNL